MLKLAVIGAGSWGTALANVAVENGNCKNIYGLDDRNWRMK